jgi:hypothetical protein
MRVITLFKRDVWAPDERAPEAARHLRTALDKHLGRAD